MGKFDGVLLAVDYDGTIRPFHGPGVPEANRKAAKRFMEQGGLFTLATGRDQCSWYTLADSVEVNCPLILNNGAQIFDPVIDESLYEAMLPFTCRGDFKALLEAFPDVGMEVLRGGDLRICRRTPSVEAHLSKVKLPLMEADMDKLMFPWTKVVFLAPGVPDWSTERSQPMLDWLNERFPGKYEAALSGAIMDVIAPGVNKGTGVDMLAQIMDIEPENVFCAGDGWNDLAMVGHGRRFFAPEGAIEPLKAMDVTMVGPVERALEDIVNILEELYS